MIELLKKRLKDNWQGCVCFDLFHKTQVEFLRKTKAFNQLAGYREGFCRFCETLVLDNKCDVFDSILINGGEK